jgi:hypothetical protein
MINALCATASACLHSRRADAALLPECWTALAALARCDEVACLIAGIPLYRFWHYNACAATIFFNNQRIIK